MIILLFTTKKNDLYLVKCEFEVEFINYTVFIKTAFFFNTSFVNVKNFLVYHIHQNYSRGFIFSQIHKNEK